MAIKVSGTTVISDGRALQNITDIPNITKPSTIEAPTNGSTDSGQGKFLTIDVSPFQAVFGVAQSLTVQLDNNSDFSSPLYNTETVTSGSEVEIDGDAASLPVNTLLYVRARYKDSDGIYGDWTPTISFTTRGAFDSVNTPSITSPSNNATNVNYENPTFTSSVFATSGGSYNHNSSSWQISTNENFTSTISSSVDDISNKTSWTPSITLSFETSYYVRVRYYNSSLGYSDWSSAVFFTTAALQGESVYTTPGSYQWTAPTDVTSVSAVVIGGGGGGGGGHDSGGGQGGALAWKNNIAVTPGTSYNVVVGYGGGGGQGVNANGSAGTASYFLSTGTVNAGGGSFGYYDDTGVTPAFNSTRTGDGGGDGGGNGTGTRGGGGGAGGYEGAGGRATNSNADTIAPVSGSGAGSAGVHLDNVWGWGGGGVGIFGKGNTGSITTYSGTYTYGSLQANTVSIAQSLSEVQGKGGSGGENGHPNSGSDSGVQSNYQMTTPGPRGGIYGGGGGGSTSPGNGVGGDGASGAVRILWGSNRTFPSTNVSET
jgi:hypothetical protein